MGLKESFGKLIGLEEDDEMEIGYGADDVAKEKERLRQSGQVPEHSYEPKSSTSGVEHSYEKVAPLLSNQNAGSMENSINGSAPFKMLVIEPTKFDDCTKLVDNLKARKPVIVNLQKLDNSLGYRIFNFLSGATYALEGNVQSIGSNIYIFAPRNVDIAARTSNTGVVAFDENQSKKNPWG